MSTVDWRLRMLQAVRARLQPTPLNVAALRQQARPGFLTTHLITGSPACGVTVTRTTLPGTPPVPVRLYRCAAATSTCVLYAHGGGWAKGDPEAWDPMLSRLGRLSGALIVSVDYRLAPEHPYPAALDDMHTALVAVAAGALGPPPARLVVMGDSAGGYLAAATARRAPQQVALQVLVYPVISPACDTPSYARCATGYGLTAERMRWYWRLWAPDAAAGTAHDLLATVPAGLPPACIVAAEHDVLASEAAAYAAALRAAGVPVDFEQVPGMTHGFLEKLRFLPQARDALRHLAWRLAAEKG